MAKKEIGKQLIDDETGEVLAETSVTPTIQIDGPFWKTPWNHDRDNESLATSLTCRDPSKTQQQFAKETDINEILRKFLSTGELPATGAPAFADVEETELMDRMVTAWEVDQAWDKLPPAARAILRTPQKFVEWYDQCIETGNIEGLREIGLIPTEKEAAKAAQAPSEPPKPESGGSPAPDAGKAAPAPAGAAT